ncbi:MAG: 2Fe-2S iron-sulfur cluster-binding protein [Leadbetterella sp.]
MKTYFLQVKEVIRETQDTVSIRFWHPLNEQIKYKAGQFVTVIIPDQEGKKVKRSYSMSSSPITDTAVAISIKKVKDGYVSNYLNTQVNAGDFIEVVEPMGNFYAEPTDTQRSVFLIAAGSGITPLFSILKTLLKGEATSQVHLLYGNKRGEDVIFKLALDQYQREYSDRFSVRYIFSQEAEMQRIDADVFNNWLDSIVQHTHSDFYMCGPDAMMESIKSILYKLNIDKEHIHYERFNAPVHLEEADLGSSIKSQMVTVNYEGQTHVFKVEPHQTVLEAALDQDIDLPYSCQAGMCTACLGKCTSGKVKMDEEDGLTAEELKQGFVLTCVTRALSEDVVIDID